MKKTLLFTENPDISGINKFNYAFSFALSIMLLSLGTIVQAQITSQITYGGIGEDDAIEISKTSDGYAIGGFTNSFGAGGYDFYLVKTDESGNLIWSKTYGSANNDLCFGLLQATDGGFVLAGYTNGFGSSANDVLVIKTDSTGAVQWTRKIGGFQDDFTITLTGNNGYILVGTTKSFGSGQADVFLCKLDVAGNVEWSKAIGGSNFEWGGHISQTNDGGYIASGIAFGYGSGNYDFYIVKLDANGNILWTKSYGGTNRDDARHAEQTSDGGYIIAGYTQSFGAGATDILLIKTDAIHSVLINAA